MGYRIDFAVGGRTMQVKVRGRSSSQAAMIGRAIADEARRAAAERLLIDVRGLVDRLGALHTLVLAAGRSRRVAVVDSDDNQLYHPFSEAEARRRGYELRYFYDAASAMAWLHAADSSHRADIR
jgi:hypothetical protein